MGGIVSDAVAYIFKIVIALGISMTVWLLVVGTDGLGGPSILKQNIWSGVSTAYNNLLIEKTDRYGYGYGERTEIVWDSCASVLIQDERSPQGR